MKVLMFTDEFDFKLAVQPESILSIGQSISKKAPTILNLVGGDAVGVKEPFDEAVAAWAST